MIQIDVKAGNADKQREDAVVLPLLEGRKLTESGKELQKVTGDTITDFLRKFDLLGDFAASRTLYDVVGMHGHRAIFLGVGSEKDLSLHKLRVLGAKIAVKLEKSGARGAALYLTELEVKGASLADKVQAVAEGIWLGLYKFDKYQSKTKDNKRALRSLNIMVTSRRDLDAAEAALKNAKAVASGTIFARDLGNEPGNVCTPEWLGDQAAALSHKNLKVTVMDKAAIEKAGFTALLAVNQGSVKEPRFIVLEYNGGKKGDAPVALVGKGLTFDAGGISIKPAAAMDEMKFDMCGAASVIGTLAAIGELQPDIYVVAIVPSCENMPDGDANKPGDVVASMSGQTIEVLNTDAEGRLILCDALTYSEKFNPNVVIDVATLTGACVIALGSHAAGLIGNHSPLVNDLLNAGQYSGDRAWELPLWDEYQDQLKSNFADIANIGGKEAGTITAACFLSRFTKKFHWAHLDIAGVAWNSGKNKGATGRPVPLLTQYLLDRL